MLQQQKKIKTKTKKTKKQKQTQNETIAQYKQNHSLQLKEY